jgi:hypothetical protein
MKQLSMHYDIEIINERHYFKELDWKILIPKSNNEAKRISLHNISILKGLILLNQHNPLYNSKIKEEQTYDFKADGNEEVRKKLIFELQSLSKHEENFE